MSQYTYLGISPADAAKERARRRLEERRSRRIGISRVREKTEKNKRQRTEFDPKPESTYIDSSIDSGNEFIDKVLNKNKKSNSMIYIAGAISSIAVVGLIIKKSKKRK